MEILQIICKLLQDFMDLDNKHIYIYNQKWLIPTDKGLFISVGLQGTKVFANNSETRLINNLASEVLTIHKQDQISINIYSYDFSAIERKEEILMALNSNLAENLQNKLGFHLGKIPITFNEVSEIEGTKILNRFNLVFNVISKVSKTIASDYYNSSYFITNKNN